jgi:hypothetical protein
MPDTMLLFPLTNVRVLPCWLCLDATFALIMALDIILPSISHCGAVRPCHDLSDGIPRRWALSIAHGDARWGDDRAESLAEVLKERLVTTGQ